MAIPHTRTVGRHLLPHLGPLSDVRVEWHGRIAVCDRHYDCEALPIQPPPVPTSAGI